ncbi:hypothetical protein E0L35_14030 [Halomonas sp. ATBC28]|uniref:hypothetical protein n=1 Tax=Halomonas sp. ATBC28 TaxID=2545264 RepID=UPI00110D39AF|nr:hypothetical protein [Halomonas sp. ATBC28]TMU23205.1 hypothetical protein E0L35_14030 [Halomonas sp. ATBC28]
MHGQHLLVTISGHGLGHLSQASAVINSLSSRYPRIKLSIRSSLATTVLQEWISPAFTHYCVEDDIGMRMTSALDVDLNASEAAYTALHDQWDLKVEALATWLRQQHVTHVLTDVAYLPLAAAQYAAIPSAVICSLNWAEVIERYFSSEQAKYWKDQARQAYQQAKVFIQPAPSMPMLWLDNRLPVAPIGRVGRCQREALIARLALPANCYIVLVGMGGMALSLSARHWANELHGRPVHYLLPDSQLSAIKGEEVLASYFHAVSHTDLMYQDLMASVDLMITKPGYGTFVEAAATGLPLLFVARDDWPDSDSLVQWIEKVGLSAQISRDALADGKFSCEMEHLLNQERYPAISPSGADQAADYLVSFLHD